MTKDEMSTLLRSVGVNENTVTAMENAYELGFEQGADVGDAMRERAGLPGSRAGHDHHRPVRRPYRLLLPLV